MVATLSSSVVSVIWTIVMWIRMAGWPEKLPGSLIEPREVQGTTEVRLHPVLRLICSTNFLAGQRGWTLVSKSSFVTKIHQVMPRTVACCHFPEGLVTYCWNHSAKNLRKTRKKMKRIKCKVVYIALIIVTIYSINRSLNWLETVTNFKLIGSAWRIISDVKGCRMALWHTVDCSQQSYCFRSTAAGW